MAQREDLGDLERPHELKFQEREWRAGRVGWIIIFSLVVATALGLFGSGPLSRLTLESADGALRVRSQRLARFESTLRVDIETIADETGTVLLRISRPYLTSMRVERIVPDPDSTGQEGDSFTFRFAGNAPGARSRVIFDLQPAGRWQIRGQIADAARRVDITQFIYP